LTERPSASTPPRLPFALAVGVTGHRLDAISAAALPHIERRLGDALDLLAGEARALAAREAAVFAEGPPTFTLVSPLADGADQIAAEVALERGFRLQAILPFARNIYLADFDPASKARFRRLAGRADCQLELPGERAHELEAYVMAGRATVAHCDVLIAVWDGLRARGRGGTADVVQLALARGTPIIHIPLDPAELTTILWAAFDPTVVSDRSTPATRRPFVPDQVGRMLAALLAPPDSEIERQFLEKFLGERERGVRPRIEYPLLLMFAGTRRFRRADWDARPGIAATRDEWIDYRAACADCHGVSADLDRLESAYGWADRLATHFAQSYRSGHVFNFLLAATGVLLALAGLVAPQATIALAAGEFVVVLAILVNTSVGLKRRWHQRWLDYRQLAERLRPMRSLKLLGIASPDAPGSAAEPVARRWIDWYAAGVWRTMGCPSGNLDGARADALSQSIADREIESQIQYNRSSGELVARLDHRLDVLGFALFAAALAATVVSIIALIVAPDWAARQSTWFVIISAGLPAVGTAIFGIRVQGDFGGTALRAQSTADLLERIARDLDDAGPDLSRAADLVEQAARVMLKDLGEWRLVHEQHELAVG
jgi:hypothetical protein